MFFPSHQDRAGIGSFWVFLRWFARLIICAGSLFATEAMAIDVANQTDWNTAVAAVAAAGAGSTGTTFNTSSDIKLP